MTSKVAHNRIDLSGKRFGKWLVISYCKTKNKQPFWNCKCDCGTEKVVGSNSLRNGSKSCHCSKINNCGIKNRSNKSEFDIVMTNVMARYRCEARNRGLTFELEHKDFIKFTQSACYYCEKLPSESSYQKSPRNEIIRYNGIDRVNNSVGYNIKNCVTCCKKCNTLKRHIPVWMVKKLYNLILEVENG